MYLFKDDTFEKAVEIVLLHEGGLTNNPNDPGGITDYGISLRFLRAAGIDGNMNRSNHITADDIKSLTPKKAKAIYYTYFWIRYNIDKIKSQLIATSLLDMSVLMGGNQAAMLLQRTLNRLNESKITVDGITGPKTLALINNGNASHINFTFKDECRTHLMGLVAKNEKLKTFLDGWMNRVNSL